MFKYNVKYVYIFYYNTLDSQRKLSPPCLQTTGNRIKLNRCGNFADAVELTTLL